MLGWLDPSNFLLFSGKSKTLISPRSTVQFSCHQVGKGKLQATPSHRNPNCESELVNLFLFFSWKVNSFKDSNLFGGSFPPDQCDSGLGDLLFSAPSLLILKTLISNDWVWSVRCPTWLALLNQRRYCYHKGGAPVGLYSLLCASHSAFLIWPSSAQRTPTQVKTFFDNFSTLPLLSFPQFITSKYCTRLPSVSQTRQSLSSLRAFAPAPLAGWLFPSSSHVWLLLLLYMSLYILPGCVSCRSPTYLKWLPYHTTLFRSFTGFILSGAALFPYWLSSFLTVCTPWLQDPSRFIDASPMPSTVTNTETMFHAYLFID